MSKSAASFTAYLKLLSEDRWEEYDTGNRLGFAIYNFASEHCVDMKACWLQFTISNGWDEDEALTKWDSFQSAHHDTISLATIKRWAKQDNPEEYMQLLIDDIPEVAHNNWQRGDYGLAVISHHLLKDILKLPVGRGRQNFLYFDDSRYVWDVASLSKVKLEVSWALGDCLTSIASKLFADALLESDVSVKDVLFQRRQAALKAVKYVQSNRGLSNIVSLGRSLFRC